MTFLKFQYIQKLLILYSNNSNYSVIRYYSSDIKSFLDSMAKRNIQRRSQYAKQISRKQNSAFLGPSRVYFQILGSGAFGVPSSLYLSTDHSKYIFNCGEGTQRLAHEHHLRLTKLDHIFFTSPTWKNMGGLPGLALTIQDMGVIEVNLHGPTGICDIFNALKNFVFLSALTVKEAECSENSNYVDPCMQIRYVHLRKSTPDDDIDNIDPIINDNTNYYAHEVNSNGKRIAQEQKLAEKILKETVYRPTRGKITGCVAYICKLHSRQGSLDLSKCVDKGITPGPLLGELKAGNDVTLPDGTIVKSEDVCSPPIHGPVFIVLECPNEDYLDSLINHKAFNEYGKDAAKTENIANFIFHFTPDKIMNNPRYIEWMSQFGKDTQHIILNENNSGFNFEGIHRIQYQLNLLHPTIFPILHDGFPVIKSKNTDISNSLNELKIYRSQTLDCIHLRPLVGLDKSSVIEVDKKAYIDEVSNIDGFLDTLDELQTNINAKSKLINELSEYPKILMLGTGSCIPNKVRNVSGILIRIDEDTSILLDCGEGTAGQLIRFFGPSQINKILASIKAIYVSHLHADHHLGLLGILQYRKSVTDEPIFLLAPMQIQSFFNLYHYKFEHIKDCYIFVSNQSLLKNRLQISPQTYEELKKKLKINDVCTTEVYHCLHSFGVAWHMNCGKKIVYSGDTKPCPNLVEIGYSCDLLIHEATMEDELEKEANQKMHSTTSGALKIAEQMQAKFTLLTHFSQRYSKIPRLPSNENLKNVGIAYDNMQFSMAESTLLPLFYPSLRLIFSEFCDTLEKRAEKRNSRNKMKNVM